MKTVLHQHGDHQGGIIEEFGSFARLSFSPHHLFYFSESDVMFLVYLLVVTFAPFGGVFIHLVLLFSELF